MSSNNDWDWVREINDELDRLQLENTRRLEKELFTEEPVQKYRKCTCGVATTYGEDAPAEFHSDWCELNS